MILVLGGVGSGKWAYVTTLGYSESDVSASVESDAPVLSQAQEAVRDIDSESELLAVVQDIASRKRVVMLAEVGSGIVPIDPAERAWRDRVGQLGRELAARADEVVRMVCGIPTPLKTAGTSDGIEVVIMRHGTSTYNEQRRYAGWTDVPLSEKGRLEARAAGVCPQVKKVYVSPLLRARQTAQICFPNAEQVPVDGLQEMNFGDFEGRTAAEMENDAAYRSWVEGMCTAPCPNGEGQDQMIARMERAVSKVVHMAQAAGERRAIIVAHGGTIMAALTGISGDGSDYFGWQVGNCEGYRATVTLEGDHLRYANKEHFENLEFLQETLTGKGEQQEEQLDAAAQRPDWQAPECFFQNRECKYFPCHEGVPEDEFNCMFCYCPLYALGPSCGGNFVYMENGRKSCMGCKAPHVRDHGAKLVMARYQLLAELASQ